MENEEKRCILICAGDLTVGGIKIRDNDLVIAVDGGLMYCKVLGIEPDLIIGDFDSVEPPYDEALERIENKAPEKVMRLPSDLEMTDTAFAVEVGLKFGCNLFYFYAASGGRSEHVIGHIQLLRMLKEKGCAGYIMDGDGMMLLCKDEAIDFHAGMEGYISVLALDSKVEGVSLKNLKREYEDVTFTNTNPIGISNEFVEGKAACVSAKKGTLLLSVSWAEE